MALNEEIRRYIPGAFELLKVVLVASVLPGIAIIGHLDTWCCLAVIVVGVVVFFTVWRGRMSRGGIPIKPAVLTLTVQGLFLLVLGNITETGPLWELSRSSALNAASVWKPMGRTGEIKTMSVILPCANEGLYAVNTARSIGELTPKDVLVEIIVVDDGSSEPLEIFFKKTAPDILEKYPIKFVRHETFTGLINAKKQGGDRAIGDVLTFLDCHVLPRDYGLGKYWSDGIMSRISENYKRVVVPSITDLDADKWEEIGKPDGVAKCYLSMDVDFRWFDSDDDYVPIMSGGLLAMSRDWWYETGGYDSGMVGWGGENIDQSLRIWLCGGEIVHATDSHVAHMWRTNDKPQTKAKYTVPEGATSNNRYRVAMAWMDEYIEKANDFPVFSQFVSRGGKPPTEPLPDISSILAVKERMKCKPFQWFLDKFSGVYRDGGVLPSTVFRIRDTRANLCIARRSTTNRQEHGIVAAQCSVDDPMQLWHRGNRNESQCCSGLRSYDSMYCLAGGHHGKVVGNECNTYGRVQDQHVDIRSDGEIFFNKMNTCLSVGADANRVIKQSPCDVASDGVLNKYEIRELGNGRVQIREIITGECLTAFSPVGTDKGSIELAACSSENMAQQFEKRTIGADGDFQLVTWENLCLDTGDGEHVLAYVCYDTKSLNKKQVFKMEGDKIRNMYHPTCLSSKDTRIDMSAEQLPVSITGCIEWDGVGKPEQIFQRIPISDAKGPVLLKSGKYCLAANGDAVVVTKCPSRDRDAPTTMQWLLEDQDRVRNKWANRCIDGNDNKTPIMYPCYDNKNDNQEWRDSRDNGFLKNGRGRMCLDYHPLVERDVAVSQKCKTGAKWSIYGEHESKEMGIYKATKAKESAPVIS
jgi:GT2 family glycosyltransferase